MKSDVAGTYTYNAVKLFRNGVKFALVLNEAIPLTLIIEIARGRVSTLRGRPMG